MENEILIRQINNLSSKKLIAFHKAFVKNTNQKKDYATYFEYFSNKQKKLLLILFEQNLLLFYKMQNRNHLVRKQVIFLEDLSQEMFLRFPHYVLYFDPKKTKKFTTYIYRTFKSFYLITSFKKHYPLLTFEIKKDSFTYLSGSQKPMTKDEFWERIASYIGEQKTQMLKNYFSKSIKESGGYRGRARMRRHILPILALLRSEIKNDYDLRWYED